MISIKHNKNTLKVKGHGKDIVCSAVSTLMLSTVNHMHSISKESINFSDINDVMMLQITDNNEIINILYNNLITMLKELTNDYKENIKFESEE